MAEQPSQRTRWLRIVALVLLTGAAYLALRMTGALDRIDVPGVRAAVLEAGVWGVGLFALVFALGELIHVPGMIFVGAGILAYGPLWGFGVSLLAAIFSVCVSFVLVRAVGGQLLAELELPFARRMLARLDERPVTSVIVLRTLLWRAPPLNSALALSGIRFRDSLIGSAVGLLLPVAGAALFFDWLFA